MKRDLALQPLSRDHHDTLVLARALERVPPKDDGAAQAAAARWAHAFEGWIDAHFSIEEAELASLATVDDARRLQDDHRELRSAGRELCGSPSAQNARLLGALLRDHVRWEDRALFPALEKSCSADELARVGEIFSAHETARKASGGSCDL